MNAVGKNLKQLRQRAELTQDALAERLHVTRQAVSSWETGKTQPDIGTLTALADAVDADVRELIYGPERVERPYTRFQRRYVVCTAICGLGLLAWILMELILRPYIQQIMTTYYIIWPELVYLTVITSLCFFSAGILLPSAISLWADIRLPSRRLRLGVLAVGLLMCGYYLLWAAVPWISGAYYQRVMGWFHLLLNTPLLRNGPLFLSGCLLFLGLNK